MFVPKLKINYMKLLFQMSPELYSEVSELAEKNETSWNATARILLKEALTNRKNK